VKHFKITTENSRLSARDIADNFDDLHPPLDGAQAIVEAGRCLYCYDAPCMNACPTRIDIPKFIHQIRSGNLDGSAQTILSANIMGGACARACPTEVLCEEVCVVHHTEGAPVKIGELQRHAVDHLMAKGGVHPFARAPLSGYKLAVVGAGPAGLSFAHRTAMLGHDVVVYEAKSKPGGLNEYGLAAYKMANDFAQVEVAFLLAIGGVTIEHGKVLGDNLSLDDLRTNYDAVFVGAGLTKARGLGVDGENLAGVGDALEFIETVRVAKDKSSVPVGDNVVVIGGGNTAIDAAVQAKCLGARNVTLAYRRGPDAMTATQWERDLATANGVIIRYWAAPKVFSGAASVERAAFSTMRMDDGKLTSSDDGFELPADMVLKAIGQTLNSAIFGALKLEGGKIVVDAQYQTSLPGVYAGGDCITSGEDLTVQAVEDGKQAAIAADIMLRAKRKGAGE
jgi:dihydropyrimidine dehydrogenase (NAD+) subunit PreT